MYKRTNTCGRSDTPDGTQTISICAGEACETVDTVSCSAAGESVSLPKLYFEEQVYTYSFIPEEALQRGTMFPELVN